MTTEGSQSAQPFYVSGVLAVPAPQLHEWGGLCQPFCVLARAALFLRCVGLSLALWQCLARRSMSVKGSDSRLF